MSLRERFLVALLFGAAVAAMAWHSYDVSFMKHLDSVFLFESAENFVRTGRAVSETNSTIIDVLPLLTKQADAVCSSPLGKVGQREYNVIENHAYMMLYPISLFTALASPEAVFAIANSLAHVALLLLPYVFLRRGGLPVLSSLAFSVCVAAYPAWSISAIGDYYLDRLYMPFALLSAYLLLGAAQDPKKGESGGYCALVVSSVVVTALFTERAAIMMCGLAVFFLALYPGIWRARRFAVALACIVVALLAYIAFYKACIHVSHPGSPDIAGRVMEVLRFPMERLKAPGLFPFLIVNLSFFGVFIAMSGPRLASLALGAMLPNVLLPIGGGELNGWATHYHTMYIPFVIFAASIGYKTIIEHFSRHKLAAPTAVLAGAVAVILACSVNPWDGRASRMKEASLVTGVIGSAYRNFSGLSPFIEHNRQAMNRVEEVLPQGVRVSTTESIMPSVYKGRKVSYFPIDLETSDFVVVSGQIKDGEVIMTGAISYLGAETAAALNACLFERMLNCGYVLRKNILPLGILVFERLK